jgi:MFS family permease
MDQDQLITIEIVVPKKHRPIWIGTIFFSSFVPLGFGPVITQILVTETAASWRWCFYIGVIVSGTRRLTH